MSAAARPSPVRATRIGAWSAQLQRDAAASDALVDALVARVDACMRAQRNVGERVSIDGTELYLKGTLFPRRARLRHALRSGVWRRPLPRLCEAANLAWLRAHGFGAPLPLVAGALWKGGLPRFQFLATRFEPHAEPLREALATANAAQRVALTTELARDVARLHALEFVHRDLYPRNVLVGTSAGRYSPVYLDAWRGGARMQLRGAGWDLACLFLEGTSLWSLDEQHAFLDAYTSARAAHGSPCSPRKLLASVATSRVELARRALRAARADLAPIDRAFERAALLERLAPRGVLTPPTPSSRS